MKKANCASTVFDQDDPHTARRHLRRVIARDLLAPLMRLDPLPDGTFDRLEIAADDYFHALAAAPIPNDAGDDAEFTAAAEAVMNDLVTIAKDLDHPDDDH